MAKTDKPLYVTVHITHKYEADEEGWTPETLKPRIEELYVENFKNDFGYKPEDKLLISVLVDTEPWE